MVAVRLVGHAVPLAPGEGAAALWSFAYFFCILCSYYLLRPVRDAMAAARGAEQLPWLFTATFLAMLVAVPLFGTLSARYPRRTLLPIVYSFFIACILALFAVIRSGVAASWTPAAFFVWVSVFNLFVVSVFWSFMADLWREEQARRLFGFISAGGSAGALLGPALAAVLALRLGQTNLLPLAAAVLSIALLCIARLRRRATSARAADNDAAPVGGHALGGVILLLRSRYLLAICGFMALATTLSTFVYFQQAQIVRVAYPDAGERTAVFALIDFSVNALTIATQLLLTARLLTRWGLTRALPVLPVLTLAGFAALAAAPTAAVLVPFQVTRRAAQYAITGPAREILFTVTSREEKYKAKNVIDTVVYRGGDALSGWAFSGLAALGLGLSGIAVVALPLTAAWIALAVYLGREEAARRSPERADASRNFSRGALPG